MISCMKQLKILFLLFVCIFNQNFVSSAAERLKPPDNLHINTEIPPLYKNWKSVPLRTQAQKDAGLSGGEGMQMVHSISYAPSNPEIVYFVSDTSQVWKSTDSGNSWQYKRKRI